MSIPIPPSRYGARDFGSPLPSLCNGETFLGPFTSSTRSMAIDRLSPTSASGPMSIQGSQADGDVPPPLPPPRLVPIDGPIDPHLQLEHKYSRESGPENFPDSFGHSFDRRDPFSPHELDEGYQSIGSMRSPLDFPSPGSLHSYHKYRPNDGIDSSMLDRLNGRRRLDNRSPPRRPGLSSSAHEARTNRAIHTQLTQLSLPHRSKPFLDSSGGFTKSPVMMSAISPRSTPFGHGPTSSGDYRSPAPTEIGDLERSPNPRSRRTNSGSIPDDSSTQGSYEISRDDDTDFPMEETSRLRTLYIDDPWREKERDYYQAGQKRRASSPPGDDLPLPSDQLRRREGMSRGSPVPRLGIPGSTSSVSSASRSGSYASHSLTASSITSVGSFGRRSPNALSPACMSPIDPVSGGSPYSTPMSLATSPRSSISRSIAAQQPHQRTLSEHTMAGVSRTMASPRKLAEMPKTNGVMATSLKKGRPFLCECCPKKPKKFDTEEDLNTHAAEKQYECSFCGNRFKNKNEAERHQNSLHVRRHSWSCSALTGYERAFHDSTTRPGEADVCGYCGTEFNRTGPPGGPNQGRFVSDQDWEERIRHLQDVHKFRECNASKKFFRADHFRQHLKHSHHGSSGKWTNMLENACMMEEDPPVTR